MFIYLSVLVLMWLEALSRTTLAMVFRLSFLPELFLLFHRPSVNLFYLRCFSSSIILFFSGQRVGQVLSWSRSRAAHPRHLCQESKRDEMLGAVYLFTLRVIKGVILIIFTLILLFPQMIGTFYLVLVIPF